uniref:Carboxylesterase type B domain-containing protein n=1 Tax=Timema monikensis TaxID=170555 RepID=A0A7R9EH13_9NEOP|nr:unnamed protein product [Timema monikensis]
MCAAELDMVTVTVKQGSLRGRKVISRPGSTYYSFQGVPYAKPPFGYRRFKCDRMLQVARLMKVTAPSHTAGCSPYEGHRTIAYCRSPHYRMPQVAHLMKVTAPSHAAGCSPYEGHRTIACCLRCQPNGCSRPQAFPNTDGFSCRPEPPDSWSGIRDALIEDSVCIHTDSLFNRIQGKEDCLYLNVYTPQIPGGSTPLKPVMVWIHGGGFVAGSGNTRFFGPDYLVHADVVLVTLNYRLGVLGFLCLNDTDVSGNNGLKDQVLALKWVQQNIAQFAGDPGNVTIFGESAGGACVHYHMLSHMSKGLFHRAIAQSGSALNPWAFTKSSRDQAFRLGELLGCATDNARELVSFLRSVPASSIIKAQDDVIGPKEIHLGLFFPFVPSLENDTPQAFLSESPMNLIKDGLIYEVPFISGITTHEGIIHMNRMKNRESFLQKVNSLFQKLVPADLVENRCPASEDEILDKIRQFYFKDRDVSERTLLQYIDLLTDTQYGMGVCKTVKEHAASYASPVYYYQFAFDGQLGLFKKIFPLKGIKGACHADDLGYLFFSSLNSIFLDKNTPEMKVLTLMVQLWTSFAKNGIPQAEEVTWRPVSKSELHCLTIDHPLMMFCYISRIPQAEEVTWRPVSKSELNCLTIDHPLMMFCYISRIPQSEGVTWLPVTKSELHCLTIDHPPHSCTDPHKERMSFWTELYHQSEDKTKL